MDGCFLCTNYHKSKDGHCQMQRDGKSIYVHRYIYEQCFGEIPDGYVIRHTCDNASCINPEHLILGTHQDNVRDRVERGRSARGNLNGRSKLTELDVIEIRNSRDRSSVELGREYGVDPKAIRSIWQGKTWTHIDNTYGTNTRSMRSFTE